MDLFYRGLLLGNFVFFLSVFMDLFVSPFEVRILKHSHFTLLLKGYVLSFFNLCVITPTLYSCLTPFVVNYEDSSFYWKEFFLMVLFQNIGYYAAHWHMHNGLYWIHKFHHQYNRIVIPSSAFAVTVYEFLYAYISPLLISALFIYPSDTSFLSSVGLIALCNLFIHSPTLQTVKLPKFLVSPIDHLIHHEFQNTNFAAPVFALDRLKEVYRQDRQD